MADDERDEAPDLKIFGDEITFTPSGVEPATKEEEEGEALMKPFGSFRTEPLKSDLTTPNCRSWPY